MSVQEYRSDLEKQRGFTISQYDRQWNTQTQTGHLDPHTVLHKRYDIIRTVGHGGMGAVYQARDLKQQRICAIKEMSLSMVPVDERAQAIQNFKSEAKMLWGLSHVNLPAFYGFFIEDQRYFLVMEYIDGYTLEELLEQNKAPFSERRVLGWGRQLSDVLEYLHSQNPPIIFRDMKPGNIMLLRNGRIMLIDFGIARFFRPSHSPDTQLLGTPGFAPPEQYGKSQTDERSDVYALAITLAQLLTNKLSESGFGLRDVRASNPQISPRVAHALEKAASLTPEDRYENVAAFRRALLGVGTFEFENGDEATTPEELADLCARYPEEAADYLSDGEIDSWLRELGETELAREARHLRAINEDSLLAVEQFIQTVMGPNARLRGKTVTSTSGRMAAVNPGTVASRNGRGIAGVFARKQTTPVQITPRRIDFGQVYPGVSAPLSFTVAGRQGESVSGTIHTTQQWIMVDQSQFDGMSTRVNVRVNTTRLAGGMHYSGDIIVALDHEDTDEELVVTVEADVISYTTTSSPRRGGKTFAGDLDDEDDDDLTMGTMGTASGLAMMPPTVKAQAATSSVTLTGLPNANTERDEEYKAKYGHPGSNGWDPLRASSRQRLWMQRGLTFSAALMLASLCYTLVAQLPALAHQPPLMPNAWMILVLMVAVPAATLGSLLVHRNDAWTHSDFINRACTGMGAALLMEALTNQLWQLALKHALPSMQMLALLIIVALGATVGSYPFISDYFLRGVSWGLNRFRGLIQAVAIAVGAALGFLLTTQIAFSLLTPLSVLLGSGIILALVMRVKYLLKQNQMIP